jgi:hypothetical protein
VSTPAATPNLDLSAGMVQQAPGATPAPAPALPKMPAASDPDLSAGMVNGSPDPNQPDAEEQAFLQANPDHKWMVEDPKFPNRPTGIYPTGRGNEWRNDPAYTQAPVDLHFVEHTLEGAGAGALAVAPVLAPEIISSGLAALKPALLKGIQGMGEWAAAHPVAAKMIWEGLKTAIKGTAIGVGAKVAGKVIESAPDK